MNKISIKGFPWDEYSSFLRGSALAPARIREAFYSDSSNLCTEGLMDLGLDRSLTFMDDWDPGRGYKDIEQSVSAILHDGSRMISLGGDHSIAYPVIKAHALYAGPLNIVQLDAHGDLYDSFQGNQFSHACPFARIMEEGLAKRLIQVGIRTQTPHQKEQADRFGVEVIEMKKWDPSNILEFDAPLYLSLDLDVLDPAFAPGVSHYEPGGMTTREVIRIIQNLPVPLVGADIVELNPLRDLQNMTAMVAAKCLKEIIHNMLS